MNLQKSVFLVAISSAFLISLAVNCECNLPVTKELLKRRNPARRTTAAFSWQSVIAPAFSVLGSGLIVGVIGFLHNARLDRKRRRAELLDSQLRELYGPLQFFASCSQSIYGHAWKIEEACDKEYGGKNASRQAGRSEEIQATIDVNNEYFELVNTNIKRMVEVLTSHYSHIEPDDAEIFSEFLTDSVRHETEFSKSRGFETAVGGFPSPWQRMHLAPRVCETGGPTFSGEEGRVGAVITIVKPTVKTRTCRPRRTANDSGEETIAPSRRAD